MYTAAQKAKNRKVLGEALVRYSQETGIFPCFSGYAWGHSATPPLLFLKAGEMSYTIAFHKDGASIKHWQNGVSPFHFALNYKDPVPQVAKKLLEAISSIEERLFYW